MPNHFTHYWRQDQWNSWYHDHDQLEIPHFAASSSFSKLGVKAGD